MFKKAITFAEDAEAERAAIALADILADEVVRVDISLAFMLLGIAADEHADLIVTSSDDAAALLHEAPCPVAVVARAPRTGELRRIVVGFDGSEEAAQAVSLAEAIAGEHGATLSLLTVAHPVEPPARGLSREAPAPTAAEARRAEAEMDLDRAVAGSSTVADGEVVEGDPADELVRASGHADLVVVGSRGYGAVRRAVAGSTSHRLVRHAACPVLVTPRRALGI